MRQLIAFTLLSLCAAAMVSCATTSAESPESAVQPQIVAKVNGKIIKHGEYKQELDSTYQRFHQAYNSHEEE